MSRGSSRFSRALLINFIGEALLRIPQLFWDLWAARILSVAQFGVWSGMRAVLQLAPHLPGVPLAGLDLQYSRHAGAGDLEAARRSAGQGMVATIALTALALLVLAPGLVSGRLRELLVPGSSAGQFELLLAVVAVQGVYTFFVSHLRNRLRFGAVNSGLLAANLVSLAAMFVLLPRFGVIGALIAFGVSLVLCMLLWWRHVDVRLETGGSRWWPIVELLRIGLPLTLVSFAFDGLRLISRWFVGQSLGVEALGLYGTTTIFSGAVFLAGTSSSRVVLQFAARSEGARMPRLEQVTRFLFLPGVAVAAVSSLAASAITTGAYLFVPWWAPRQVPALEVLRPALYTALFVTVVFLYLTVLRAQGRLRELTAATMAALALQAALLFVARAAQASLWWYMIAETVSFALLTVVLVIRAAPMTARAGIRFLLTVLAMFGATIASLELGAYLSAPLTPACWRCGVGVQMACILGGIAIWLPVAWASARDWMQQLAEATAQREAGVEDGAPESLSLPSRG